MNKKVNLKPRNITGIAIRTCNQNQQAAGDIARLWEQFWSQDILNKIPDKVNNDIYCVYMEYESDFAHPYTTLIGCETWDPQNVPEGMKSMSIDGGEYIKQTVRGKLSEGIVVQEWMKIWQSDLPRMYKTDFELYKAGAVNPDDAEINIFVGVK